MANLLYMGGPLFMGIPGQLIGLLEAFKALEQVGDISPALLAGGLKISMITILYGILIYLFPILIWFLLDLWYLRSEPVERDR